MDDSGRRSISSSGPERLATYADENDHSYQETGTILLKSKKSPLPPRMKSFMSPTISAASKNITSRKKILAERRENSDSHIYKIPIPNSKSISDDSSSRPYDPLTNYLSPRPQFLRYKPNRRRQIILRCENEIENGKESLSSSEEGSLKQESEKNDEFEDGEEEEEEEVEEERCGFLRRILEIMGLMFVLMFCTMYISSMNSLASSPDSEAMDGFKDGYFKIQGQVYESVRRFGGGDDYGFFHKMGFNEILWGCTYGNGFSNGNVGLMMLNHTTIDEANENENMVEDNVFKEKNDEFNGISEMVGKESGKSEDTGDHDIRQPEEGYSDQIVEDFDKKEKEIVEDIESLEDKNALAVPSAYEQENEVVVEPVKEDEDVDATEEKEKTEDLDENDNGVLISERIENSNLAILKIEAEDIKKEEERLVEQIEAIIFSGAIGVSIFLAILVLTFYLNKERNTIRISPSLAPKPCDDDQCSLVKNEDAFKSPVSSTNFTVTKVEEDPKEMSKMRAPLAIELLGEFDFGEMSSCSSGVKRKMTESEESSSYSGFLGKEFKSKVFISAQPESSDCSAMNSYSYGEYNTPDRKVLKKQEVRDGDTKKVVLTPLRRSSRIRSRGITSP